MQYDNKELFYDYFKSSIISDSKVEDNEKPMEEAFTERMLEELIEIDHFSDIFPCRYKGRGVKVDGYYYNTIDETEPSSSIDLIISLYDNTFDVNSRVSETDIKKHLKWCKTFFEKSRSGGAYDLIDESAEEPRDLAKIISKYYKSIKKVRITFITNGNIKARRGLVDKESGYQIEYHFWDLNRLWEILSSNRQKELITINFKDKNLKPIECVSKNENNRLYSTYISLINGQVLRDLYDEHGTKLLERNVRAFLQQKNKVNRGIKDTIINEPEMFLAYNNGITVTANEIETSRKDGKLLIDSLKDFQIVNGGQTVASLWHTNIKQRAKLHNILVQMKVTVIKDDSRIDELAKKISAFSNAQNAVNQADFSSNSELNRIMEKLSKSVIAPDPTGGNATTFWFFERSRGAYLEAKNLERTPAKQRVFSEKNPKDQKFSKLDWALLENTWILKPDIVSKGAQACYKDFISWVEEEWKNKEGEFEYSDKNYMFTIAKLIIWKATEKIVSNQPFKGYRRNIVTYTIAYLLKVNSKIFNYAEIWKNQSLDKKTVDIIDFFSYKIREIIISEANKLTQNVTEYSKKPDCWNKIIKIPFSNSESLLQEEVLDRSEDKFIFDWSYLTKDNMYFLKRLSEYVGPKEKDLLLGIVRLLQNKKNPTERQFAWCKKIISNFDDNFLNQLMEK